MQADQNSNTNEGSAQYTLCQSQVNLSSTWQRVCEEAKKMADNEPALRALLEDVIFNSSCLEEAIAVRLSRKLAREDMTRHELEPLLKEILSSDKHIVESATSDMLAIVDRDAACVSVLEPLLFFKGFASMQTYRISHSLWNSGRRDLALYFQSIGSEVFGVDIHPAAQIGCGILMDHATSVVIGETAIVEDNVSIMHEVTLGGTGKVNGDRHPVVRTGVMIGAGTKILGRVEIGAYTKIGAGSVVLKDIASKKTAVGVPAVVVGEVHDCPAELMDQEI